MASLNDEQLNAFYSITETVLNNKPGFFFVSGYGGTGKTYLWNAIISYLRAHEHIVLTVAASGVASLLLPGGRTAHSRFKIPCDLEEGSVCDIKRGSMLAELVKKTSLVIWDEALMTHRTAFETLNRTFQDLLSTEIEATNAPFGGKVVVLRGDPRQILPVIEGGTRQQIVNAAIINSPLWSSVQILKLTSNMRLRSAGLSKEDANELELFSKWILDIGEGKIPAISKQGETEATWVQIPNDLLLTTNGDKIAHIVENVYENLSERYMDPSYLRERAILTPTNDTVDAINNYIVYLIPGEAKHI